MKTGFPLLAYVFFLLLARPAVAEPIHVPGLETAVELSLPENHDPAKSWPVVFFYHGLGAPPSTDLIRQAAGKRDWIVVGMEYRQPQAVDLSLAGMQAEIGVLHQVRDDLAKRYGADPNHGYVAGFSLGGWTANHFFRLDRSLAGAVILGAGRSPDIVRNLKPFTPGTPLFIGIGRLDSSYPFALKACLSYVKEGATVRMETWNGLGHDTPKEGSPGLKEWLALQNGGAPDEAAMEEEYARLSKLPPLDQWRALVGFRDRPYVNAPGQAWPEKVQAKIAELEKDPAVAPEARTYAWHRRLLAQEVAALTLDELEKVTTGYAQLTPQAGQGPEADLVASDQKRVVELLVTLRARAGAQAPPASPAPPKPLEVGGSPKGDIVVPGNPRVRK